jgi:hypothetical protein
MKDEEALEQVAHLMGMKPSEVREVVEVGDGVKARTHDGRWTLIRDDGTFELTDAPAVTVERDHGVAEPDAEAKPAAKPDPKRRS